MNHPLVNLLVRWLILALGVGLSATLVPGIDYSSGSTLALVVVLLSLFNAVLKPLLVLFTLPFIVFTLGIGVWLINSLLFYFVGKLVDGFHVAGFGSAMLGALIVSLTNLFLSQMRRRAAAPPPPAPPRSGRRDDVIDV
ncbi:MAG: phage holin family protein [Candidatus Didemnitutus sp.]|nr:phage holin family protein [Candidatus Didemnitutus sp.]